MWPLDNPLWVPDMVPFGTKYGTAHLEPIFMKANSDQQPKKSAPAAYSIPQAGAMVGLSRNGSYDAAKRGEIPVLEFGKKKVVPKAVWDRKLGLRDA
jgi:hypothetical protein